MGIWLRVKEKSSEEETSDENLPKNLRSNHLFISFAPIDNPQIAIAILVEHSAGADKMAGEITSYYFKNLLPPKKIMPQVKNLPGQ